MQEKSLLWVCLEQKQYSYNRMKIVYNVQRSVSSGSGMSTASNPDGSITSSSSGVEIEEKLSVSVMQMNISRTTTNSTNTSAHEDSVLEEPGSEDEASKK